MEWKIIHIDETDSTNHWLKSQQCGEDSFSVNVDLHKKNRHLCVLADYQTAGRGCGTNTWESERGKNLTFSLLIYPTEVPANRQFAISEWVSVALCETLEQYIYNKVEIKWPNDIYVEGKKIAGILIENTLKGDHIKESIIGIGLNVNQQEFLSNAPNPVSLCQLLGHEVDREALLMRFLQRKPLVPTEGTDCFSYRNRLYRKGQLATYQDQNGCFKATIMDVEPDGRLVMVDEEGRERRYAFKEVQFIIENSLT